MGLCDCRPNDHKIRPLTFGSVTSTSRKARSSITSNASTIASAPTARCITARLELLLVGYFEGSKLLFAGKVHQGLNPANRLALLKLLQPLTTTKWPFANLPTTKSGHWGEGVTAEEMSDYVWLRPEIKAEIKFAEWTTGEVLRHAEFVSLRQA